MSDHVGHFQKARAASKIDPKKEGEQLREVLHKLLQRLDDSDAVVFDGEQLLTQDERRDHRDNINKALQDYDHAARRSSSSSSSATHHLTPNEILESLWKKVRTLQVLIRAADLIPGVRVARQINGSREPRNPSAEFKRPFSIVLSRQSPHRAGDEHSLELIDVGEPDEQSHLFRFRDNLERIITHRIRGDEIPPFPYSIDAKMMRFDKPQTVQVEGSDLDPSYYPIYKFTTSDDLDLFLSKIRGRTLLKKFKPIGIYRNGKAKDAIAKCNVVRLWEKTQRPLAPTSASLTIWKSPTQQQEWDLHNYEQAVLSRNGRAVDLRRKGSPRETITFDFSDRAESSSLLDHLNFYHLSAADQARLMKETAAPELPHPTSRSVQPQDLGSIGTVTLNKKSTGSGPCQVVLPESAMPIVVPTKTASINTIAQLSSSVSTNTPSPSPIPPGTAPTSIESTATKPLDLRPAAEPGLIVGDQEPFTLPSPSIPIGSYSNPVHPVQYASDPTSAQQAKHQLAHPRIAQEPQSLSDFRVAIICALGSESEAVKAGFDEHWDNFIMRRDRYDDGSYSFGSMGPHNIVLVHMPKMGKGSAVAAAGDCRRTFVGVELCLVVGICGSAPYHTRNKHREPIVLGDVIISTYIRQYNHGRQYDDELQERNTEADKLTPPNKKLKGILVKLCTNSDHRKLETATASFLKKIVLHEAMHDYPLNTMDDKLYGASYRHKHRVIGECDESRKCQKNTDSACQKARGLSCNELGCEDDGLERRTRIRDGRMLIEPMGSKRCDGNPAVNGFIEGTIIRDSTGPRVHFGGYASGDVTMKSGLHRDRIAEQAKREPILGFEQEGAGVCEKYEGNCLVIKGVADYADSHKSKGFQNYAAATAVACVKAFLIGHWQGSGHEEDVQISSPADLRIQRRHTECE